MDIFINSTVDNSTDLAIESVTPFDNITTTITRRPSPAPINAQALLNTILMTFPEYRLATSIYSYGYITEVVVGSLANILALVVMLGLKHLPTCNYMAALALSDLFVLLVPCLLRWLLTVNIDPRPSNTAVCRLLNFVTYWSFSLSAWILVAMTVDRCIAISFPLRAIRLSTPRKARVVIGILTVATAIVNIHFLITLVVEKQPGIQDKMCVGYDEFRHFIEVVWPWVDAVVHSFLPFSFLIIFNFLIIRSHRKSIIVTTTLKGSKPDEIPMSMTRAYRRVTVTLLVVAFTFIATTAPKLILQIIRPTVFNFKPAPNRTDYKILAQYTLAASLVNVLMYSNHCINFFLYVLTGRKFREQLFDTFKCYGKRQRRRRVQSAPADINGTDTNTSSLRCSRSFTTEDFQSVKHVSRTDRYIDVVTL